MYPIQEIDDLMLAFPASVKHLMPSWEDLPDECKKQNGKWQNFFVDMFFKGY